VLSGKAAELLEHEIFERLTLAVDVASLPGRIRHRFPVFEQRVYVNSCSQGALSDSVRDAYGQYLDDWDEHWGAVGVLGGTARGRARRRRFSRERGRGRDRGHDVGVGRRQRSRQRPALRRGTRHRRRQQLRVSDDRPDLARAGAARPPGRHVPAQADGTIPLERFADAIDERTALVATTHVCFRNGGRLDVEGIARLAHERGALVLVDAYQTSARCRSTSARSGATSSRRGC
jgi:hypothetical protein